MSAITRRPRVLLASKSPDSLSSSELDVIRRLSASLELSDGDEGRLANDAPARFDAILVLVNADEDRSFGLELTRRLRSSSGARDRPTIIGLFAEAPPASHARGIAAGMDSVLIRPIDAAALRRALSRGRTAGARDDDDGEPAVLAAAAIEQLRRLAKSSPELLQQLIAQARDELAHRGRELRDAVARADASRARLAAHTLKSIAASVGAERLAQLAADYEDRAIDGDVGCSRSLSATFNCALDRALRALDELCARSPSPRDT